MDVRTLRPSMPIAAATNWLAFAATLVVSFFLTPYLIKVLGTERYGVWCIVESVLAYFTLLDMGLAACLVRFVARHHAREENESLNRLASSCLALFLIAGIAALLVGSLVLWGISERLEKQAGYPGDLLAFMLLMLLNLAMTLPLSIFPSILDGLERFALKSAVRLVFLSIRTLAIVLQADQGLFALALVYTLTNILEHLLMALLSQRLLPQLRFRLSLVDRETLSTVRTYSVDAFLAMLAGRISLQTGAILIGLFLPTGLVTIFVTAVRLVEYAKSLLRTITTTLTPGVSAMEARGEQAGIVRLFLTSTRWLLYAVVPVNLGLWFFGEPFLIRWVPDVGAAAYPPLTILAATLSLGIAQSVASRILYGLGKLRAFARAALLEAAMNLLLTVLLIHNLEITGVAIAVAVPNVLFSLFVLGYTLRLLQIPLWKYLKECAAPLLASGLLSVIWLFQGAAEANWPSLCTSIVTGLVPYLILVIAWEWIVPKLAGSTTQLGTKQDVLQGSFQAPSRPHREASSPPPLPVL